MAAGKAAKAEGSAIDGSQYGLEFLDPMSDESTSLEPVNAVIYGVPGSGKTALAMTAPDPLLIDFEKGGLRTARAVLNKMREDGYEISDKARIISISAEDLGGVQGFDKLNRTIAYLREQEHPFKSVIIDPIGEMQKLIMKAVIEQYPSKRPMGGQPVIQDWGKALEDAAKVVQALRALPLHTIIVAHSDQPQNEDDDIHPLVSGKNFKPFLEGAMDLLGYLYVHQEEAADGTKSTSRVLVTESNGRIRAKNRGGKLPALIQAPNLRDIFEAMDS